MAQIVNLEKEYAPSLLSGIQTSTGSTGSDQHCWYLGYGSNMCEQSFLKRRGIKPLRSLVVYAPSIRLEMSLPGLPWAEPRFANIGLLSKEEQIPWDESSERPWGNGLVGVAYLVTLDDMAKIFATEGGGSSYKIIQVECEEIGKGEMGEKVLANTLYSSKRQRTQLGQASARYMNLLITGAKGQECVASHCYMTDEMSAEKSLPESYITHLQDIDVYRRTSIRQTIALVLIGLVALPTIIPLFTLARLLRNKSGGSPGWVIWTSEKVFKGIWGVHDLLLSPLLGSGEVTDTR